MYPMQEMTVRSGGTVAAESAVADEFAERVKWEDFLQGKAQNTLEAYEDDLNRFSAFMRSIGVLYAPDGRVYMSSPEAWQDITAGLILAFREWMMQQGYAIASVNRALAAVKGFARRAGVKNIEAKGFGRKVGRQRDEKRALVGTQTRVGAKKPYKAVTLTLEGAKTLRNRPNSPQGRRDAVLMALLLDHGLRCGEVALLTVENFDLSAGVMTFYRPKVDKVQKHRLTQATLKALEAYKPDMPATGPLLRSSRKGGALTHEGMTERSITGRVRDLGKEIGIDNLSAHDCRHYWATRATEAGTHPRRLQQAGGWNSPAMVMRYVNDAEIANEGVIL